MQSFLRRALLAGALACEPAAAQAKTLIHGTTVLSPSIITEEDVSALGSIGPASEEGDE